MPVCWLSSTGECGEYGDQDKQPPPVIQVAVRVNPASYYWVSRQPTGLDQNLLEVFAEKYGVELEITPVVTARDALSRLESGKAQIAAGSLTATPELTGRFAISPSYYKIRQQVLYRYAPETAVPNLSSLKMRDVEVSPHFAHIQTLARIKRENRDHGNWRLNDALDSHHLIALLNADLIRHTIADSNEVEMYRLFYPYVKVAFTLADEKPVVWFMAKEGNPKITAAVNEFFTVMKSGRKLEQMIDLHYSPGAALTYAEKLTFISHADSRLPRYKQDFVNAAQTHGLDWKLLAAMAYQESHWDKTAVSPTGVKGLMMITLDIAKKYKVDRNNPHASIIAGTDHLMDTRNRIDWGVEEPDRTWMALAAYNLGLGHLRDAVDLTRERGGNPALWLDIATSLDLLQQKKWYKKSKHGKPRGGNGVLYVHNVRAYQKLLVWLEEEISTEPPEANKLKTYTPPR